jgi:hypothetical protein
MASVSEKKKSANDRERLVTELKRAMDAPSREHLPFVFSQRIGSTDAINTTIVTQVWHNLSHQERSDVIVEAHRRLGEEKVPIALGLTFEEATASGLLPYSIIPLVKDADPVSRDEIRSAMLSEGAVETRDGLSLRFADADAARNVYRRLSEKVPGPYWQICHEITRD